MKDILGGNILYKLKRSSSILLTLGVVLIIGSWVFSFSFGYALKDYFIKPRDAFLLGQSIETYYLMIVAFVLLGISLIILSIDTKQKSRKNLWAFPIMTISIVLFFISYNSYYYANDQRIANKELFSLKKQEYQWSEIEKMEFIFHIVEGGSQKGAAIKVYPKNGDHPIYIEWDQYIFFTRYRLEKLVLDHGGEVKTVILDKREK